MDAKWIRNGSWILWCMAIPCLLHLIMFAYVPLCGWVWAFFKYKPGMTLDRATFKGLDYFIDIFTDKNIIREAKIED